MKHLHSNKPELKCLQILSNLKAVLPPYLKAKVRNHRFYMPKQPCDTLPMPVALYSFRRTKTQDKVDYIIFAKTSYDQESSNGASVTWSIAHELSHHLLDHTSLSLHNYARCFGIDAGDLVKSKTKERAADRLALFLMRRLGYSRVQICGAIIGSLVPHTTDIYRDGGLSHPSTVSRILAVLER